MPISDFFCNFALSLASNGCHFNLLLTTKIDSRMLKKCERSLCWEHRHESISHPTHRTNLLFRQHHHHYRFVPHVRKTWRRSKPTPLRSTRRRISRMASRPCALGIGKSKATLTTISTKQLTVDSWQLTGNAQKWAFFCISPTDLTDLTDFICICHFFVVPLHAILEGERLWVMGYRLQVTGYGLQVTGYGLQVTGYRSAATMQHQHFCVGIRESRGYHSKRGTTAVWGYVQQEMESRYAS